MEDTEKNIAQSIRDLVRAASVPTEVGDDAQFVIIPRDARLEDLEFLMANPRRKKGNIDFVSIESFLDYVKVHVTPGTRILLNKSGCALAIIDGSGRDNPQWEGHTAQFRMTFSDRWNLWDCNQVKRRWFKQLEFAEFIEENTIDFATPNAADMLEIARTLEAEQNSKAKSAIKNFESRDIAIAFERTTNVRAGAKGDLTIPQKFTIRIPILEDEDSREIELRLRYKLEEGALHFGYEILQRTALLEEVKRSIFATINNELNIKPLLVA